MSKKIEPPPIRKRRDPTERVRKIGEREEVVEHRLTEGQIDSLRIDVMALLEDEERLKEKKAEVAKNYDSQIKTVQLQRNELRRTITAKKRKETVLIEEHLTAGNEVVRLRKDTGEVIGQRTATPRELQEDLFDKDKDKDDDNKVPPPAPPRDEVDDNPFGGAPS